MEIFLYQNSLTRLIIRFNYATKGDLVDQERKLVKSGLERHFHHIEIMSDNKVKDFRSC
jgi:putative hydrolase of the HAD superfamily